MRENEDGPTIIIERESGGGFGAFVLGALVGAGTALLLAPRSGEETRRELERRARELKGAAEDRVRDAQRQLEERLEVARTGVRSQVDHMRQAVDAGREAARDARSELERRIERSKAAYRAGVDAARATAREAGGQPAAEGASEEVDEG